jgi:DNA-binding NarL/FixJ family response regulator
LRVREPERCPMERRWKVLIVENDPLVAWTMDEVLSLMGFEVVGVATRVSEALRIAESKNPHLAIFDVRLAGRRDGVEGASLLRDRLGLPSVFVNAHGDGASRERANKAGAVGYIDDPVHFRQLISVVTSALEREGEALEV